MFHVFLNKVLLLWASLLLSVVHSNDLRDITQQIFNFSPDNSFIPTAFGDFNSDKLTDMVVLKVDDDSKERTSVKILIARQQSLVATNSEKYFSSGDTKSGTECRLETGSIVSAVPADFDGDGGMDLLLLFTESETQGPPYTARILWGEHRIDPPTHKLLCFGDTPQEWRQEISGLMSEPLVFDYDGDYTADLLTTDSNNTRIVYNFRMHHREVAPTKIVLPAPDQPPEQFKAQHSNAYIDLNDDGAADLFITTQEGIEMYENLLTKDKDSATYRFHKKIHWPANDKCTVDQCVGQAVFTDFALSGKLDMILPICFDPECGNSSIFLVPLAEMWAWEKEEWNPKWQPMTLMLGEGDQFRFLPPAAGDDPLQLLSPRVGDVDLDGFPDLIMTMYNKTDGKANEAPYKSQLLLNVPCSSADHPFAGCMPYFRRFQVQPGYTAGVDNTILSSFFDLYEDGRLDLISVETNKNSAGYKKDAYKLKAFTNRTQDSDAYFLKVIVLSGSCSVNNCYNHSVYVPYGTNSGGQTVRYQSQRPGPETFDEFQSVAGQLAQTSHFSLQLPYTIFGLGMAPNFVDFLKVSVSNKTHSWPQIIPNSQLYVLPYPPDNPDKWEAKLFLYPGKSILYTGLALVGTCVFVSLLILALHLRERRQDHQAKLQEANRFHFDAM